MKFWFYISQNRQMSALLHSVIQIPFPISLAKANNGSDMFQSHFLRIKSR